MWILLTAIAGTLGAAVASGRDQYRRKAEIDDLFEEILFGGTPTLLESFEFAVSDVFAVYVEEDVLMHAEYEKDQAVLVAMNLSEGGDYAKVDVTRLRMVPPHIAEQLVSHGTSDQYFSDGYAASNAAIPYIAQPPTVWDFDRHRDMEFHEWSEDAQQQHREYLIQHLQEQGPELEVGMKLYTGLAEEDWDWDEDAPEGESRIALTNNFGAAERMAHKNAAFLEKVFGRPHAPRVVTWHLAGPAGNILGLDDEGDLKNVGAALGSDFTDTSFEDIENLGPEVERNWGSDRELEIVGWRIKDAYGPGAHSIVLFKAPLKWVRTDPVRQMPLEFPE